LQTVEAARRLGEIDRGIIERVLNAFIELRMAGDIDGMLEYATPDIVCFPETTWRHARYPRPIIGKEAVREAFKQRHINYITLRSVVHRAVIDGDQAAVRRSTTIRGRGGGADCSFDSIDFLRFRDGLVTELCELPDGRAHDVVVNFPH
jgi:ketosteroid isomerase-like protein